MTPGDHPCSSPADGRSRRRLVVVGALGLVIVAVGAATIYCILGGRETLVDRIELSPGALTGWNVLLISLDTVRRDHVGCYGHRGIQTPVLDGLARDGIRFDQAVTPVPMTLPGHATMLTGLNPQHHGARVNGLFSLNEKVPTLPEVLRRNGYQTGAIVSAFVLDRRFGLNRGFDLYDDDLSHGRHPFKFGYRERGGDQVTEAATAWLRAHAGGRFFLFLHYFDPHWPYSAPEPFAGRYKGKPHGDYDAEIAFTDHQIGRVLAVLDELKVRNRTLVIALSDHGEGLDEHNEKTHTLLLYDTTLRVPLIMSGPSPMPHRRLISRQVGLIDLMPTVLDLLGMSVPGATDGVSLLQAGATGPRDLYIETLGSKFLHGWAPLVGIRRDDRKLVVAPQSELYDLQADPNELRNLFEVDRPTAVSLHDRLRRMVGGDTEMLTQVAANLPVDRETRDKLGALGYVITTTAPSTSPTTAGKPLPDPKEMILAQRRVEQAQTLVQEGRHREALLVIEPYLEKNPDDVTALNAVGESYRSLSMLAKAMDAYQRIVRQPFQKELGYAGMASVHLLRGDFEEAEAACRRALEVEPGCLAAILNLGLVYREQDRDAEATRQFEQVIREGRGTFDAPAWLAIAQLHWRRGRLAEAKQAAEKAIAADSTYAEALTLMADLQSQEKGADVGATIARLRDAISKRPDPDNLLRLGKLEAQRGRWQEAEAAIRDSIARRSDHAPAHLEMAQVLQELGKTDDAITHLREACRLAPKDPAAAGDLGTALAKQGRFEEARGLLERATRLAPQSPSYHYNLGLIYARLNNVSAACEEFRKAIELKSDYVEAHHNLGVALQMQGKAAEAAESLRRAEELRKSKEAKGGAGSSGR